MMVEFGLAATALFLLTLGTIDAGRLIWDVLSMQAAVDRIARCRALDQNNLVCPTVTTYVQNYMVGTSSVTFTAADSTACPTPLNGGVMVGYTGAVTFSPYFAKLLGSNYSQTICYARQY